MSAIDTTAAKAGINQLKVFADLMAASRCPAPICLPMMMAAALPVPMKKIHVNWEMVLQILKAEIASVPAWEKIEFCRVIPKPQNVSLKITGKATLM